MKFPSLIFILLLWICLHCWPHLAAAQNSISDDEYTHHSYQEAIRKLKGQLEKNPDDGNLLFHLGDSYRLNGQMKEAENYLAQAVQHNDDSRAQLYYAQVLLCNRKYLPARDAFRSYAALASSEADANNAKLIANTCETLAKDGPQPTGIQVQKADFNSEKLDFSPAFWKPGYLVFASNRIGSVGPSDEPDPWTEDPFVDLWMVTLAPNGTAGVPTPFSKELNSRYHEGPMCFSRDGGTLYFTRSDLQGNIKRGYDDKNNTRLKIYAAAWLNDKWMMGEELPFNSSKFSTCHPALSMTEDSLIFSSDRPGGYGGMDLWLSIKEGKSWSAPHNLGPAINTAGNELFPYIHADGSLYFSSDFMAGYGGLDIFTAQHNSEGWIAPQNMGSPINSSLDDYGITLSENKENGHFSSNRSGHGDDIYSFLDMAHLVLDVTVAECGTEKSLTGISLQITQGTESHVYTTDTAGRLHLPVQAGKDYALQAYGMGYYAGADCDSKASVHVPSTGNARLPQVTLHLSRKNPCCFTFVDPDPSPSNVHLEYQWRLGDGTVQGGRAVDHCYAQDGTYQAQLEIVDADLNNNIVKTEKTITVLGCNATAQGPTVVEGIVRDKRHGTPLPFADVELTDQCTGKPLHQKSDSNGHYQFVLPSKVDCDHWLIGKKEGFATQEMLLPLKGQAPGTALQQNLDLESGNGTQPAFANGPTGNPAATMQAWPTPPPGYIYVMTTPINAGAMLQPGVMQTEALFSKPLAQGDVIELYNIYFDLDKYAIRPDAETDLQFMLTLMRKYPHMQGELSAHTDSRASDTYNMHLSHDRAMAAKAWLVARGVDPMRLSARGYGEYQLRNNCGDDVYCTELEHQRNRRVEFRVTQFDGMIQQSKEYECFLPRQMSAYTPWK